jgi:ribosomal-protein-alanine N-acetyltransferase
MTRLVLTTQRLYLRETTPQDAEVMFALNSDPEVLRFTGDDPFDSIEEVATFLANYSDFKKNNMGRWAVIRQEDEAVLGWCGLKLHPDGMVDLGFRLFKKFWNQGVATEASLGCLKYGFETLNLTEIVGRVVPENVASASVLQKIGMRFSHVEIDNHHGEEIAIYKITHEDFRRN